ncbi:MAG: response regulator transcription factor [Tumebacillaceae bacterium]
MQKVAIIEDDESTNNHLRDLISGYDVEITQAFTRDAAITLLDKSTFDLAIVDVDLGPGPKEKYAGFEVLSLLGNAKTITLVVSGAPHSNIHDVAISLQAYDFIGKPIPELSFINKFEHALLASKSKGEDTISTDGALPPNLTKDPKLQFALRWKNKPVRLTLTHLRLVTCLVERPGVPVKRETLNAQMGSTSSTAALATHISEIRQRFIDVDSEFDHIQSEPGVGYVWKNEA